MATLSAPHKVDVRRRGDGLEGVGDVVATAATAEAPPSQRWSPNDRGLEMGREDEGVYKVGTQLVRFLLVIGVITYP